MSVLKRGCNMNKRIVKLVECIIEHYICTYYATQKEVPPDTGLALFTISSRQDSTVNESHLKVKFCAALPRRNCKQSEPGVTGYFFLGRIV